MRDASRRSKTYRSLNGLPEVGNRYLEGRTPGDGGVSSSVALVSKLQVGELVVSSPQ